VPQNKQKKQYPFTMYYYQYIVFDIIEGSEICLIVSAQLLLANLCKRRRLVSSASAAGGALG